MANDLISRSALIDRFDDATIEIKMDLPIQEILGEDVDIEDFFMLAQEIVQQYRKLAIDTIQKQPIAYDVERVVEELQLYKQGNCTNDCEHFDNGVKYGYEKGIDDFVNAVKAKFPDDRCGIMNIEIIAEQLKAGDVG